mgnify:CR=1 FL=1
MKKIVFTVLFLLGTLFYAGNASYEIKNLSSNDRVYSKFKRDIKSNYKIWKKLKRKFQFSKIRNLKRLSISIYRVKDNDTIFTIAEKIGIVSDTIISFNSLANSLSLNRNDEILIPNMDGIVLFPRKKTYIREISRIYKIPKSILMYINNIQREYVYPKEELFIPFARLTDEEKNFFLAKPFIYPLKGGKFSSHYGMRKHPFTHKWTFHGGVDIAVPNGTKVYASAGGRVIYVGWGGGYGKLVVLKHKYGYTTWYGHLSKYKISKGQYVRQGTVIAKSGNTGRSTGPHLHFEVRRFNLRKNPLEVLDFTHRQKN